MILPYPVEAVVVGIAVLKTLLCQVQVEAVGVVVVAGDDA